MLEAVMKVFWKRCIVSILILNCILMGCSTLEEQSTNPDINVESETMRLMKNRNPDFTYEVPTYKPNILVNQAGYSTESEKTAIFLGEQFSDTFNVIDASTGTVVYSGDILLSPTQTAYGSFTQLENEGTYYIQTDVIGRSYNFEISNTLRDNLFNDSCIHFISDITVSSISHSLDTIVKDSLSAVPVMMAYEFFPQIFTDELSRNYSNNSIPDIIDGLKPQMDVLMETDFKTLENSDQAAIIAAVLTKFSVLYKAYDATYSKNCLRIAETAYTYIDQNSEFDEYLFYFAAAELYKATGYSRYHTVVRAYAVVKAGESDRLTKLYGDIAYLSARRWVDVGVCNTIMEEWMGRVEKIVSANADKGYLLTQDSAKSVFADMTQLIVVDYIISSHEYADVLNEQMDYFFGRNSQSVSYVNTYGDCFSDQKSDMITADVEKNALFLFAISDIKDKYDREDS